MGNTTVPVFKKAWVAIERTMLIIVSLFVDIHHAVQGRRVGR
jgi:hypothetical protein